jgi:hypothetical protein
MTYKKEIVLTTMLLLSVFVSEFRRWRRGIFKYCFSSIGDGVNNVKYLWLDQFCHNHTTLHRWCQGSPNQAKWATSSPWFQWNRPIFVKKRSFSRPVSLFKSVFFSPIIILFLQYSHKRISHVPEIWPIQGLMFNILFQTC